jgi:hypothetical protein
MLSHQLIESTAERGSIDCGHYVWGDAPNAMSQWFMQRFEA